MVNLIEVFVLQICKQLQYKIEVSIFKMCVGIADIED